MADKPPIPYSTVPPDLWVWYVECMDGRHEVVQKRDYDARVTERDALAAELAEAHVEIQDLQRALSFWHPADLGWIKLTTSETPPTNSASAGSKSASAQETCPICAAPAGSHLVSCEQWELLGVTAETKDV